MKRNVTRACAIAALLVGSGGCVHESLEGSTRVFTYELWVSISVLLAGIVAAPAGWYLRTVWARMGWALLIMGPVVGILLAPSLFLDRAILSDSTFSNQGGIWGMTVDNKVNIENLVQVRIVAEESRGRRGAKKVDYFLICQEKDGSTTKIGVHNDVIETAAIYFLQAVRDRGIPILDQT